MVVSNFLEKCLLLDLETTQKEIFHIGAVYGEKVFERKGKCDYNFALQELGAFAHNAHYLLGHNLFGHDIPFIKSLYPALDFLKKPVVDTIFLSPLAFPENPYHRLVKDYKLMKSSLNDPVADARLAGAVFKDQWDSFASLLTSDSHKLPALYRFCFDVPHKEENYFRGITHVFDALDVPSMDELEFTVLFENAVEDRVCKNALSEILKKYIPDTRARPALAYCLAWLKVAGQTQSARPGCVCVFQRLFIYSTSFVMFLAATHRVLTAAQSTHLLNSLSGILDFLLFALLRRLKMAHHFRKE